MRVQRDNQIFPVVQRFAHILNLLRVNVRHTFGNGYGQVDDNLVVGRGLPDIDNRVADFHRELGFRAGKALGRILEAEISGSFRFVFVQQFCAACCDFYYFFLALFEHLFALCDRC